MSSTIGRRRRAAAIASSSRVAPFSRTRSTLDARDTPIQDIRAVLRHDTIAATQIYFGENPLRANCTMRSFVIGLPRPPPTRLRTAANNLLTSLTDPTK